MIDLLGLNPSVAVAGKLFELGCEISLPVFAIFLVLPVEATELLHQVGVLIVVLRPCDGLTNAFSDIARLKELLLLLGLFRTTNPNLKRFFDHDSPLLFESDLLLALGFHLLSLGYACRYLGQKITLEVLDAPLLLLSQL